MFNLFSCVATKTKIKLKSNTQLGAVGALLGTSLGEFDGDNVGCVPGVHHCETKNKKQKKTYKPKR